MRFYAFHGVMEQEKKVGNKFTVDIEIDAEVEKSTITDNIEDTINYAEIYNIVKEQMAIPSNLLEHVAGRIIDKLHENIPQITGIRVKVSKINPPFGGDLLSASVTLDQTF